MQNGVVINFEKIGPDPPIISEKSEDCKDELFIKDNDSDMISLNEKPPVVSVPNTSWYNCRKMVYVPRTTQKGYPLGIFTCKYM